MKEIHIKHLNIKVAGKVQGVFFRASAKEKAIELGVTGFVRNEPDGSVYIEAEGDETILQEFVVWCNKGPSRAKVEYANGLPGEMENFDAFEIRR